MDAYIARQPIFNKNIDVIGYELLYRDSDDNFFNTSITSNVATAILLMNSYFHFGIENLVGDKTAFINFGEHLIKAEIPQLLSTRNVVIEVLEEIVPDKEILEKFDKLRKEGYTIAIDDYIVDYPHKDLLSFCHVMKIDFMGNTKEQIKQIVYKYKKQGKIFLAEKVETREEFEWAKDLGFEYFQGYFFSKPVLLKSKNLNVSATQYTRLIEALYEKEPDYKKISQIIEIDVILTYRLLRLVNSSFSLGNQITSIHHALSMLGIDNFTKWLTLAMVNNLGQASNIEIVKIAMIRSKMLELMGKKSSLLKGRDDELSLLGILSVIDVLLQRPMKELVRELPLSEDIRKTFLRQESIYLYPYELCLAYERGDFHRAEMTTDIVDYHIEELAKDYFEAVKWAEELFVYMNE